MPPIQFLAMFIGYCVFAVVLFFAAATIQVFYLDWKHAQEKIKWREDESLRERSGQ